MSTMLGSTFVVCIIGILIHIGLPSTIIIAPIEFHAYVSLSIGVVLVVTIIAVVVVTTSTTFK